MNTTTNIYLVNVRTENRANDQINRVKINYIFRVIFLFFPLLPNSQIELISVACVQNARRLSCMWYNEWAFKSANDTSRADVANPPPSYPRFEFGVLCAGYLRFDFNVRLVNCANLSVYIK